MLELKPLNHMCVFFVPFSSSSLPLLSGAPYCSYRLLRENLFTLTMEWMCVYISTGYNSARVLLSDGRLSTRLCRNISTFINERQSIHSVRSYVSSFQFTYLFFFFVEYLSPRQLIAIFFLFIVSCLHKRLHKFKTNFYICVHHWAFAHFSYATLVLWIIVNG